MQLTTFFTVSVAMLSSMVQGYVIANCVTTDTYNLSDNKCHDWTDSKYTFQSNKGCTLVFYSGVGCTGTESTPKQVQNRCASVGITPKTMKCVT